MSLKLEGGSLKLEDKGLHITRHQVHSALYLVPGTRLPAPDNDINFKTRIDMTFKPNFFFMTFCLFFMGLQLAQAQEQEVADTARYAQITFDHTSFDFKDMHQGEKAEHVFKFTNTGTAPLILSNVLTTCGCTAPEWPRSPIPPGGEGEIKIVFDSSTKMGRQNKVITVRSNSKSGDFRLRISAMVLPPKKKD